MFFGINKFGESGMKRIRGCGVMRRYNMNTRDGGEFVTVTVEEELIGVTEACATWMLEMLLPNRIYQILN